ncbi:MAG: response regulator [Sphingobacteriaceae bacterium]|nr:response regulator [Sphingobacteriaceae bacterium]
MNSTLQYIIIDDDETNNMISKYMLRQALGKETDVVAFTSAREGIDFIASSYSELVRFRQILFLDINMPEINGWQTLELINELEPAIKNRLITFMLSSSIDPKDRKRASDHPLVYQFIEKPLTPEKLLSFGANLEKNELSNHK